MFMRFFLLKYFCGFQLSSLRPEWQDLGGGGGFNTERNASYSLLFAPVGDLRPLSIPKGFSFTTSAFYSLFLRAASSVPILPRQWSSFTSRRLSLSTHWSLVRDSFAENVKNDLAWLIL